MVPGLGPWDAEVDEDDTLIPLEEFPQDEPLAGYVYFASNGKMWNTKPIWPYDNLDPMVTHILVRSERQWWGA